MAQHRQRHLVEVHAGQVQRPLGASDAGDVAVHLRRLAQQHVHRHVDRALAAGAVLEDQLTLVGGDAHHRVGRALAAAHLVEQRQQVRVDRQDIALLALVAPDFLRRQAGLFQRHLADVEGRALAGAVDQLGEGVGDAARAHVVDGHDRVALAQRPAVVDDLLRPALDLGVAPLHRVEVERGGVGARSHRRGGAAAHADAHARAAELHQQRAGAEGQLVGLAGADRAQAAGDHDRLVVAAAHARHRLLEDAEVAGQVRTAELVVERRAPQRALGHDLQRAGDVLGLADGIVLPRLVRAGQVQVGDMEARQAGLGLGAAAGRALVADLAAGAGGGARERRDGGRVVVRLDLHQHMRGLGARAVLRRVGVALRQPALDRAALHHRGVVAVGDDGALRRETLGVTDHAEHRQVLRLPVDGEVRVEDLVAAVLGVGLREHHQLDVAGVALELGEGLDQVVDLVVRQRQAEVLVGDFQRRAALADHVDMGQRLGLLGVEKMAAGLAVEGDRLGHAVVQQHRAGLDLLARERLGAALERVDQAGLELQAELGDALDAVDVQAAVVGDVGGLGGPRRHGAQARHHHHQLALGRGLGGVAVGQQRGELVMRGRVQRAIAPDPVHMAGRHADDAGADGLQARQQRLGAEGGKGVAALEMLEVLGGGGRHACESRRAVDAVGSAGGAVPRPARHGQGPDRETSPGF